MINEAYFSPGEDCKSAIIDQLRNAEKSIRICVFTISDNDISKAILEAHRRDIEVSIITDNDKTNDKGSDIYDLFLEGLNIRIDNTPNHMHHKFAIFDEEVLLTGSFNWTRSASKYNQENVIVTNNEKLVKRHLTYYYNLWREMKRYY